MSFIHFLHSTFSLIKHLLVSFLPPTLPPEAKPTPSSQDCLVSSSATLCMGSESSFYLPPSQRRASPWCLLQAGCRGPCEPPHRGPCAAAAAREVHPVLPGWLGHWHSQSGHGTPGPGSWAELPPLALWGSEEENRSQTFSNPSCHQASVWAL